MKVDEDIKGKAKAPIVDVGLENDSGSFLISQILGFKFAYYQVRYSFLIHFPPFSLRLMYLVDDTRKQELKRHQRRFT